MLAFLDEAGDSAFRATFGAAFMGLICVWFGDEMGGWTGTLELRGLVSPSPGCAVRFMGWVLLCMPYVVIVVQKTI